MACQPLVSLWSNAQLPFVGRFCDSRAPHSKFLVLTHRLRQIARGFLSWCRENVGNGVVACLVKPNRTGVLNQLKPLVVHARNPFAQGPRMRADAGEPDQQRDKISKNGQRRASRSCCSETQNPSWKVEDVAPLDV